MKESSTKENETTSQRDMESTKEWINQTLSTIHKKMVELFYIDFPYFRDIKITKQAGIFKHLTQRMRNNLKENGVIYSDIQWKQICENLSKTPVTGFFENLSFYNPSDEALYINEKMITNHPEKLIPVCAHELSEKLLSTYMPSQLKTPTRVLVEAYVEAEKTNNKRRLHGIMNTSTNLVFKSVFKEGVCEAIALHTLRHTDSKLKVASLEKELELEHSKCIDVLFNLENAKRKADNIEKNHSKLVRNREKILDEKKLIQETLKSFLIIKGISYYLGYPLAKAVVEKYGIRGVKLALEQHPPNKAQYFAHPHTYLAKLEKLNDFT